MVIQTALISVLLIYDSVRDIKYREIPNEISAAVALAMVLDFNVQNFWGLAAAAVFFITALFTGKIGGGDVKLIIALSAVCGLWGTVFLLFAAQLSMLVFYAVYAAVMKIKGRTAEKSLPFVPFITFGYIFLILLKIFFLRGFFYMNFLKNRTVLGVICIAIALVICFLITPLFNASASKTTKIIRIKNDVKVGQEITEKDIETVEVGAYNLPSDVIKTSDEIVGKYVASELVKGEYVLPSKISDTPANENNYLYGLTGEKRAISITIPSFAAGLSGKLQSGDIVSVIACDYRDSGETVVPDELQYVEVIAATDKSGSDKGDVVVAADGEEKAELPSTITLLVSPMQANILAELEENGDTHIALVYRGTAENAAEFIKAQETVLSEIEEKILAEKEKEEAENTANTENTEESEEDPTENILTETDDTTENNTADTEENTDAELFE